MDHHQCCVANTQVVSWLWFCYLIKLRENSRDTTAVDTLWFPLLLGIYADLTDSRYAFTKSELEMDLIGAFHQHLKVYRVPLRNCRITRNRII